MVRREGGTQPPSVQKFWDARFGKRLLAEKPRDDIFRDTGGAQRVGVDAAPARLHLGKHLFAPLDDRAVESPGAMHLLEQNLRDHVIL